jgi:hypothetical protein
MSGLARSGREPVTSAETVAQDLEASRVGI